MRRVYQSGKVFLLASDGFLSEWNDKSREKTNCSLIHSTLFEVLIHVNIIERVCFLSRAASVLMWFLLHSSISLFSRTYAHVLKSTFIFNLALAFRFTAIHHHLELPKRSQIIICVPVGKLRHIKMYKNITLPGHSTLWAEVRWEFVFPLISLLTCIHTRTDFPSFSVSFW